MAIEQFLQDQNLIRVPDSNLVFNPATGGFQEYQPEGSPELGQWAWSNETGGLVPLGANTPSSVIDPFLAIQQQYAGGQPIEAATWQDAVRQSLTGFMRGEYGFNPAGQVNPQIFDPIFNWDPTGSGQAGSQFRMGTLQELVNQLPDFYATGNSVRDLATNNLFGTGTNFDPLIGLRPEDKLLAFEDIPFEQIEKLVGNMPGQFLNPRAIAPLQAQLAQLNPQLQAAQAENQRLSQEFDRLISSGKHGQTAAQHLAPTVQQSAARVGQLRDQINSISNQINQQGTMSLAQARAQMADFNDFLFRLDIDPYQTPEQLIRATPESVLAQFFDTPAYRLARGNDPGVLDPFADPAERFRADPGYQFQQSEGIRQLLAGHAANGLLESGRSLRDVTAFSQNLADQSYQRNLSQDMGMFSDWTRLLQGQAAVGAGFSTPDASLQAGNQLGSSNLQTGANMSNIATAIAQALAGNAQGTAGMLGTMGMDAGTNIASLMQNQGFFGGSAFLNTGAAAANTLLQAASLEAQMMAAQSQLAASQAASGGGGGKGGAGEAVGALSSVAGGKGGGGGF